jgi:hypothetical protein
MTFDSAQIKQPTWLEEELSMPALTATFYDLL